MKILRKLIRQVSDRWFREHENGPWVGSGPVVKIAQQSLYLQYRQMFAQGLRVTPAEAGVRVFSGSDDDGILLLIYAALGFRSRVCVDVGSADGICSNVANFILNFGFTGLLIDGDPENVARGRRFYEGHPDTALYPPKIRQALVTAENVNGLIAESGLSGEIDLLSVDIDGNDFWIWKALTAVQPRVVVIETHIEFGRRNIVVPYDPAYHYPGKHPQYHGASPVAMIELGRQKGYRLVATNRYGFNFIFIRGDEGSDLLPEISVDQALAHPRNKEREALFEEIKDWEYTSA